MDTRTTSTHDTAVLSAGSLKGTKVVNRQEESIGSIEEVVLFLDSGEVAYAVLSFGGFLGMGEKLFAVPWNALTIDTANERVVLDVAKERLERAPGFDKDHWPHSADRSWLTEMHDYYGSAYPAHRR